jgi:hypothetical protein
MRVSVHGPILVSAELEHAIRQRLLEVRKEGRECALRGLNTIAERCYGEERALSWVLERANCRRPA